MLIVPPTMTFLTMSLSTLKLSTGFPSKFQELYLPLVIANFYLVFFSTLSAYTFLYGVMDFQKSIL